MYDQSAAEAASGGRLAGKSVLVTGAAGSVGAALCRRLAEMGCARLAMLDHFDHGLLDVAEMVARTNPQVEAVEILGDVRDRERLSDSVARFRPDVVIHAAALKHVHLGERHPGECVLTNLVSVRNVLNAARDAGAGHFVLVSSDKAAAPVCVMGAAKRLAELYLRGFVMERSTAMQLKAVRFGNVLGSQGSVVPRFAEQIAGGGPVTLTHPEMQRYFMSSAAAVDLVLGVVGLESAPAASYFMDMGEPVSILEMAREMIDQARQPIAIEMTGLRPGEKLKEQLFDEYETVAATTTSGVYSLSPVAASGYLTSADVAEFELAARSLDAGRLRRLVFARLDAGLGRAESLAG